MRHSSSRGSWCLALVAAVLRAKDTCTTLTDPILATASLRRLACAADGWARRLALVAAWLRAEHARTALADPIVWVGCAGGLRHRCYLWLCRRHQWLCTHDVDARLDCEVVGSAELLGIEQRHNRLQALLLLLLPLPHNGVQCGTIQHYARTPTNYGVHMRKYENACAHTCAHE